MNPDLEAWLDSLPVMSDAEEYAMAAAYAAEQFPPDDGDCEDMG